jgi:hypothetical protein
MRNLVPSIVATITAVFAFAASLVFAWLRSA